MLPWPFDSSRGTIACFSRGNEWVKVLRGWTAECRELSVVEGFALVWSNEDLADMRNESTSRWGRDVATDVVRIVSGVAMCIPKVAGGVDRSERWKGEKLWMNFSLIGVLSPA